MLLPTVTPHCDKSRKQQIDQILYAVNCIWLPSDETALDIDRVMHYTLRGLSATIRYRGRKDTGVTIILYYGRR